MATLDDLNNKMVEIAVQIADGLLSDTTDLQDKINGLKVLGEYYGRVAKLTDHNPPARDGWAATRERVNGSANA